jgi:serine palmitoyltransferase
MIIVVNYDIILIYVLYLQRISGPAYCYSASLPAMLTVAATESLNLLKQNPLLPSKLKFNTLLFRQLLVNIKYLLVDGSKDSPVIHLRIDGEIVRVGDIGDKEKCLQDIVDEVGFGS